MSTLAAPPRAMARALLRIALAVTAAANIHAASCPAPLVSPSYTFGNITHGLALAVSGGTGCFTVTVDGELWLASSRLLLSAGGVVYREPHTPGYHKLTPTGKARRCSAKAIPTSQPQHPQGCF